MGSGIAIQIEFPFRFLKNTQSSV